MIKEEKIQEYINKNCPKFIEDTPGLTISDIWLEGFLKGIVFSEEEFNKIIIDFVGYCFKQGLTLKDILLKNPDKLIKNYEKQIK